jgi:hypothetical protein
MQGHFLSRVALLPAQIYLSFVHSLSLVLENRLLKLMNFVLLFWFLFFNIGSCFVAQADLKVTILLPQPAECWDYKHAPLRLTLMDFLS